MHNLVFLSKSTILAMVGKISFGKFSRSVEIFKTKNFKKSKVHGDVTKHS